jgi:hypothetical protein
MKAVICNKYKRLDLGGFRQAGSRLALRLFRLRKSKNPWFERDECVRLWRRAHFSMLHCRGMIAPMLVQVCDGGYGKNVMKQ